MFESFTVWLGSVGSGTSKGEVVTSKIASHGKKRLDDDSLDFSSFLEGSAGRKSSASDRSASSASGSEDVLASGVDGGLGELSDVQVGGVDGVGSVAVVAGADDGVEEGLD